MPDKCIVFGCNNRPSKTEGISLHPIAFEGADEPEKRKRRKKWLVFVKSKRAHWEPTKYSAVCTKHFRDDDYEVMFPGLTKNNRFPKKRVGYKLWVLYHRSRTLMRRDLFCITLVFSTLFFSTTLFCYFH